MIIYPAIDIRGGRCVRLHQGEKERETVYYEDPLEPARAWLKAGATWVHVVDLDGAFDGVPKSGDVVRRIGETGLRVELGGGIRSVETVADYIDLGVSRVVIGTRACESEAFVSALVARYGDRIAVGIDARDGRVAVKGWVDTTEVTAMDLARRMAALGVRTLIHTDIATDGALTGPNFEAQEALLEAVPCQVIASGGVARREDVARFAELAGRHRNLDGVIVGKALYDGRVDLEDLLELAASAD